MSSKKAITPIVAVILLLMMTVSAAAGAYYWITTVQSNLQQSSQSGISSSGVEGGYQISLLSGGISCDSSSDEITAYLKNDGSKEIPSGNWYAFVKNTNNSDVGVWRNITMIAVSSGSISKMIFNSTADMTSGTNYVITFSSPKGTSISSNCRAG